MSDAGFIENCLLANKFIGVAFSPSFCSVFVEIRHGHCSFDRFIDTIVRCINNSESLLHMRHLDPAGTAMRYLEDYEGYMEDHDNKYAAEDPSKPLATIVTHAEVRQVYVDLCTVAVEMTSLMKKSGLHVLNPWVFTDQALKNTNLMSILSHRNAYYFFVQSESYNMRG